VSAVAAEAAGTLPGSEFPRERQSRAMLATSMLSFGIPMMLGGDEMGRTQQGNNTRRTTERSGTTSLK